MQSFLCAVLALSAVTYAQTTPFATSVVSFDEMGRAGGGIFVPNNTLGAPDGQVHSLGIGGNIVLGFGVPIADGPGSDLIVSENGFRSSSNPALAFAEMVFVEVSSDGVSFARFPNQYFGPAQSPGAFGFVDVGFYDGLAGATPINLAAADPQDVVEAGGDAHDLADLRLHPMVLSGAVDLQNISQVRLVDVRDGIDRDSRGVLIYDPGSGSADIDAVTAIHDAASLGSSGPTVDVNVPVDGAFEISIDDPDGIQDLDPASIRVALWGLEVRFVDLLGVMYPTRVTATGFAIKLRGPLPPGFAIRVSASVRDLAGHRSGDVRSRPLN